MPLQRHNEVCDGLVSSLYQAILILHMREVSFHLRTGEALTNSLCHNLSLSGLCTNHGKTLSTTWNLHLLS